MELNKPEIQRLLREIFTETAAAHYAHSRACGHLDNLRELLPGFDYIGCYANGNDTASLYIENGRVDLSREDVDTDRAFEMLAVAMAPPWFADEIIEAAKCVAFPPNHDPEGDLERLRNALKRYLTAQSLRRQRDRQEME